jgi:hypothetical protein
VAGKPVAGAEAGDRAVDDGLGNVARTDAEAFRNAGPKALEHDVRAGAKTRPKFGVAFPIPDDRLLPRVERSVPTRRDVA